MGRFGPNHAADPIVSTWKRDENMQIVKNCETQKPILQILCIQRGDTGKIALPGGMVDPGEQVSVTLKREFIEEALNGKVEDKELDGFFANGSEVYKGYVDDPRNTDDGDLTVMSSNTIIKAFCSHSLDGNCRGEFSRRRWRILEATELRGWR